MTNPSTYSHVLDETSAFPADESWPTVIGSPG